METSRETVRALGHHAECCREATWEKKKGKIVSSKERGKKHAKQRRDGSRMSLCVRDKLTKKKKKKKRGPLHCVLSSDDEVCI